ncbi:hypothetical protein F511_41460 [Dorcoceras hygrometricum]|uniref:Uncharacterized protein n=1 Tax=Dorcoceras hygrometricum TaxID=472368 RepID=A0A2Z7A5N3_9LAMI|nr:hypothetical protein F511_41460 [Dorcoceras hygrometricum]
MTDLCCSDFVVAAVCGICSSGAGGMSDSCFGHRSFPNEYTIEFESTLCLRLKSFLSTDLSLKKTNEQILAVERFVAVNEIHPFANISTGDVIISLRLQDLALLTSSCLLRTLKLSKMMTS